MTGQQVVVLGLGLFGASVARNLYQQEHQVLGIDMNERIIREIAPQITEAVQGDATDEATLRDLGVNNYDAAIVAFGGDVPTSLMVTVLLKNLGVPYIVARSHDALHGSTLQRIGANKIISPEEETGERLAHSLAYPKVVDYMGISRNYGISKIAASGNLYGKTLEEISSIEKNVANVVLIKRAGNQIIYSPDRFEKILEGDELLVSGLDEDLENLKIG
mgnify:FL=1